MFLQGSVDVVSDYEFGDGYQHHRKQPVPERAYPFLNEIILLGFGLLIPGLVK